MPRSRVLASVLVAAGLAVAAGAQEQAPVKLGFVDVERAVRSIEEGKVRLKELEDWARPRQEELARLGNEITTMQNDALSRRGVATEDALAEMQRRIVTRQREFEDRQRSARREFEERQNNVLKDLGEKLNEVITRYADENRFTAVFILKPNDLVYLANSADITDAVIRLYNERHPLPAKK